MKIAILGAGAGGCAAAADLSLRGFDVALYNRTFSRLKPIIERGGIFAVGEIEGFAKLKKVSNDIKECVQDAKIIIIVVPAYGQRMLLEHAAPYLKNDQILILMPGSLGSLEFYRILDEKTIDKTIKISETATLPYASRVIEPCSVKIKLLVKNILFAAFPSVLTEELLDIVKDIYPNIIPATDILETALNNGNPVTHPAPTILNAGRIEYSKGEFYLYKEGITESVTKVINAVDKERLEICRAFGYREWPVLDRLYDLGYAQDKSSLYKAYTTSNVFCGDEPIKGPSSIVDRYITEDVGYGLVLWTSLADMIGVKTPTMKALIHLASLLTNIDFQKTGRTVEKLGIDSMSVEEIKLFLKKGY